MVVTCQILTRLNVILLQSSVPMRFLKVTKETKMMVGVLNLPMNLPEVSNLFLRIPKEKMLQGMTAVSPLRLIHCQMHLIEKMGGIGLRFPVLKFATQLWLWRNLPQLGQGSTSSRQSPRGCDSEMLAGTSKSSSERKGRRGSGRGMLKENPKKANHVEEATPDKSAGKGDRPSNISLVPFGSSPHAKFAEMQPYGRIEQNNVKLSVAFTVPPSNLPHLNSSSLNNSAPPSPAFQQPFSDMQQVQLRAQIFCLWISDVGSSPFMSLFILALCALSFQFLVIVLFSISPVPLFKFKQGAASDEPCMVAAFGPSDGGRSVWEPVWRAAVERVRNQKSQSSTAETPLQSHSGARVNDIAGIQGSHQTRVLPSPVSQASSKAVPTTILNPVIPLSSPLWTISTPSHDGLRPSGMARGPIVDSQQAVSPVHPYQTTLVRDLASLTSWPSQDPFPGPWKASLQTSAADASARISTVSITETVKFSPVKSSCGPSPSSVKLVTSSPMVPSGGHATLLAVSSPQPDMVKGMLSPQQHSADPKPRKRKKFQLQLILATSLCFLKLEQNQ
ncbi:hypothetical protein Ancab_015954 [Ancistrocladus abbreviatus]